MLFLAVKLTKVTLDERAVTAGPKVDLQFITVKPSADKIASFR